jgi:hypothetical protein
MASLFSDLGTKIPMSRSSQTSTFNTNADGSVTINGADFQETIRPWGHPEGFGVSGCHREHYNGEARPLFLLHALRYHGNPSGRPQTLSPATAEPIDRIARSIPQEVLRSIYHLPHWPVELIQIAESNPDVFVYVAKQNPALVCLLAREAATHTLWGPHYFGQLLGRRENDICRQLGLPPDTAWYLRKISDQRLCAHGYLDIALSAWKRPGMRRLLRHVARGNLDVTTTALMHWEIVRECPSLLHIAAEERMPDSDFATEVYQTIEEISQLRTVLRKPRWPWRKIRDIEQLRQIRKDVQEQALKQGKLNEICYPAPPVSPCSEWWWASNSTELTAVGQKYNNCAATYHWKCLMGDCALYLSRRTAHDDTVIVVLMRSRPQGRWEVADIVGPCNALVDEDEQIAVRRHFQDALEGGAQ